jgi:hypothetical protein
VTIAGADKAATIIKPAQGTTNAGHADSSAWILVNSGQTFNLSNVTLDGQGESIAAGILSHGHGTISNNIFTNIGYNPNGPDYKGMGIELYGSDATVSGNSFSDIGRIGVFTGNGSTATITGNTYTGKGDGNFLDYGFEVGRNGRATISGNTISDNRGVASVDGSTSAGILVTSYFNPGTPSQAVILGNAITDSTDGIAVGYDETDASVVVAHNNNLSGDTNGVNSTNPTVNATNNWWGNASGPLATTTPVLNPTGTGSAAVGNVTYTPWYTNAGMTTLNTYSNATVPTPDVHGQADLSAGITDVILDDSTVLDLSNATTSEESTAVTVGGNTVTLTQAVVLQSGVDGDPVVLTNSNLSNVSASIPDGTKIQGPANWNGAIMPPVSGTPSGNAPAGFSVGNTVISIGSPDGTLVFDSPVTILLAGVTGTVGYRPAGSSNWIQITNTCGGTYASPTPPTSPGECSISNGVDTKILTYHFTTFGSLNVVPPSSGGGGNGPIVSSGGGGGAGPVAGVTTTALPGTPTAPTVAAAPATTPATATTGGQVLGAEVYNFTKDFGIGASGTDVTELQKILIGESDLSISAPTGTFGPLTKAAVVKYQKTHGISPASGYVGPKTRTILNQGVTPTTTDEQKSLLIAQLQKQLQALMAQIAALQASSTATSTTH